MNPSSTPIQEVSGQQPSVPRLIIVSNREPYEHRHSKDRLVWDRTSGGLTSALDPVMRRLGGTWIAWGSGKADREVVDDEMTVDVPPDSPSYRLRRVWLDQSEVKGGYLGYANQVLWPLCHITLDRIEYRKMYWHAYQAMNRRFADAVISEVTQRPGFLWIHDFHLALLPALIKAAVPIQRMMVFWHTPWPGADVFRICPERREIIESLLNTDIMTFQTPTFGKAFVECAKEFIGSEIDVSEQGIHYRGHTTRIMARPISISYASLNERAQSRTAGRAMEELKKLHVLEPHVRIGLGVDRLDYTKGLLKRFWALDSFFQQYPHYRGRFTFVQIAVPTRGDVDAYRQYRELIRETAEEINQRYGSASGLGSPHATRWRPIELREGRIGLDTLVAYYRMADVAVVSSVYDGMNLVAKEYVSCQVDEQGVLLVSQMAGAAEELTDALVINPYDHEGVGDAIREALEMPLGDRQKRMRRMRAHLERHDIRGWADDCLRDAGLLPDGGGQTADDSLR